MAWRNIRLLCRPKLWLLWKNSRPHTFFPPYLFLKNIFTKHGTHKTNLRQVKTRFIEPTYDTPHPISPFFNSTLFNTYYTNQIFAWSPVGFEIFWPKSKFVFFWLSQPNIPALMLWTWTTTIDISKRMLQQVSTILET